MDLGLAGRTFIIGGGSAGLGYATAAALHADGAAVVLAARRRQTVEDAATGLGDGRAMGVAVDLADADSADRLCAAAIELSGRLDGALLNVGGPPAGAALSTDDTTWRAAFDSAFLGPLRLARAVHEAGSNDAALLFLLSTSARSPIEGLATSNGLRPGLLGLTSQLADEVGPSGRRVNAILPGRIATARTVALEGEDPAARQRFEAQIPLGRYGDPVEFGKAAAFLLSPAASYITGTALAVDGGILRFA